jgi:hypothetical protein
VALHAAVICQPCPAKAIVAGVPLSLPGLTRQSICFLKMFLRRMMDARIKSGHDGCVRVERRSTDTASRSRGLIRPRFAGIFLTLSNQRAQGMPGAGAPAAARVVVVSTRVSHHEYAGNTRHSPRNGFNGFLRALPGDRALLPPSPLRSLLLKSLTPASGCQDHTTSPSALASPVSRAAASIASRPDVRDVRETPL